MHCLFKVSERTLNTFCGLFLHFHIAFLLAYLRKLVRIFFMFIFVSKHFEDGFIACIDLKYESHYNSKNRLAALVWVIYAKISATANQVRFLHF